MITIIFTLSDYTQLPVKTALRCWGHSTTTVVDASFHPSSHANSFIDAYRLPLLIVLEMLALWNTLASRLPIIEHPPAAIVSFFAPSSHPFPNTKVMTHFFTVPRVSSIYYAKTLWVNLLQRYLIHPIILLFSLVSIIALYLIINSFPLVIVMLVTKFYAIFKPQTWRMKISIILVVSCYVRIRAHFPVYSSNSIPRFSWRSAVSDTWALWLCRSRKFADTTPFHLDQYIQVQGNIFQRYSCLRRWTTESPTVAT